MDLQIFDQGSSMFQFLIRLLYMLDLSKVVRSLDYIWWSFCVETIHGHSLCPHLVTRRGVASLRGYGARRSRSRGLLGWSFCMSRLNLFCLFGLRDCFCFRCCFCFWARLLPFLFFCLSSSVESIRMRNINMTLKIEYSWLDESNIQWWNWSSVQNILATYERSK